MKPCFVAINALLQKNILLIYLTRLHIELKQYAPDQNLSGLFHINFVKRVEVIERTLLHCTKVVNNKLLVALGDIATQAHASAVNTRNVVNRLLDYFSAHPSNGIIYRKSETQIVSYSDACYVNETKA